MTELHIERLAEDVLAAHGLGRPPVDPLELARLEGVRLAPGSYDGCFEGRIEYRQGKRGGRFYLFYREEAPPRRPACRVRFSVAHELGHFFIPVHREYLVSGEWFGAAVHSLRARRLEREADWFAAALLLPRRSFSAHVQRQTRGSARCRLADLSLLARDVFETSLTSTALRYAQLDFAPCAVVLSEGERLLFGVRSGGMLARGVGWLGCVPPRSLTGRLLASGACTKGACGGGDVEGEVWFGDSYTGPLWEEVRFQRGTGRALTFLLLPDGRD